MGEHSEEKMKLVQSLFLVVVGASAALGARILPKPDFFPVGTDSRIVGGELATIHELPHQISYQYSSNFHSCGGSVYNENFIMTAAHCCTGSMSKIIAGTNYVHANELDNNTYPTGVQEIQREMEIPHEDYGSDGTRAADICLVKLSTPLIMNDVVKPVTLPAPGEQTAPGTPLLCSGWGSLESGGSSPLALQKVIVPVVSDEECRINYGTSDVTEDMLCAGDMENGGIDACQGDSGGPYIIDGSQNEATTPPDQVRNLRAIVSWGRGCALPGYPGVNTEVSYFIDWIEANVAKHS